MPVGAATLITRCPECATVFRATADQLAVRAGRVRCGHCGTVFDARAHARANEGKEALVLTYAPAEDIGKPQEALPAMEAMAPAPATPNLAFDFGRPRPARSRLSPWLAWPGAALLLLLLAAQVAYQFRGDVVLLFPAVKPYAQKLCAEFRCDLPLPRRAELMSIESSDLQADSTNPKVMVLSATLRNRAPFAQSPPALELTLTDPQDQPVARRVLAASDYAGRAAADNLFPAGSEIPVKVYFEASPVKATGYRLYLFYP